MRAREFIFESTNIASAEQVWEYVSRIHPEDQQGGGFLKSLVMKYPQYELRRIPLSDIHIPDQEYDDEEQEDEHNDPYNRAMFVDPEHAGEYSQHYVDRNPIVIDAEGYILDGNHRAWAAAELLNKTDIMAWVPVKKSGVAENFHNGKVKGKSRPGRVKRAGASCNGSVTDLRTRAKNASGEKAKMYHWCANMKSGKKK